MRNFQDNFETSKQSLIGVFFNMTSTFKFITMTLITCLAKEPETVFNINLFTVVFYCGG